MTGLMVELCHRLHSELHNRSNGGTLFCKKPNSELHDEPCGVALLQALFLELH